MPYCAHVYSIMLFEYTENANYNGFKLLIQICLYPLTLYLLFYRLSLHLFSPLRIYRGYMPVLFDSQNVGATHNPLKSDSSWHDFCGGVLYNGSKDQCCMHDFHNHAPKAPLPLQESPMDKAALSTSKAPFMTISSLCIFCRLVAVLSINNLHMLCILSFNLYRPGIRQIMEIIN